MSTLRTPQHSQTRVASPDGYAYGISAQPNGESIAKCLRSEPLSTAKRRRHHQTATLRTPQHSQTETAPPNGYAQNPSTQPNGDGTTKRLRSEPLNAAKRRRHHQTAKPSPNDYAQTYPILPPVSLLSFPVPRPWRSHTEMAPPKRRWHHPNGYAQDPSAQTNGDGITKRLHSEPLSAAKRRWQHRMPTLRTPQRSQTETAPPNGYAQRTGGDVESSHSCPAPNCLIRSTTPVIPAICNPTPITREIPPATRQSALCNPLRYADEWYETAHNTRGSIERRNENVRTYQWH